MSMQTGLVTSTTQLRTYAPATDVSVAAPAPRLEIARAEPGT
ncbi:sulfate/thiosulfate ABC transporter permease CysW, partial [Bradyrhizobium sp. Cham227]|nr:sulfate/thiosulfate ABC transporter permease CysW [Bradyrhizobium brasilense]